MKKLLLQVTLAVVLALGFNITANANDMDMISVDNGMEQMSKVVQATRAFDALQKVAKTAGENGRLALGHGKQAVGTVQGSAPVEAFKDAEDEVLNEDVQNAKTTNDLNQRVKAFSGNDDEAIIEAEEVKKSAGPSTLDKTLHYAAKFAQIVCPVTITLIALLGFLL